MNETHNVKSEGQKRFSLWEMLSVCAVVFTTSAGGGWLVGRAILQDQLNAYKDLKEWEEMRKNLEELKELSATVRVEVDERKRLIELEKDNVELSRQLQKDQEALTELRSQVKDLTKRLNPIEGDHLEMDVNQVVFLVPRKLSFALHYAYPQSASIQLGDESHLLSLGEPASANVDGQKITITLLKAEEDHKCLFAVNREQIPQ